MQCSTKMTSLCHMTLKQKVHQTLRKQSLRECLNFSLLIFLIKFLKVTWISGLNGLFSFALSLIQSLILRRRWLSVRIFSLVFAPLTAFKSHGLPSRLKVSCYYDLNTTHAVSFHTRPRRSEPYAENAKGQLQVAMRLSLGKKLASFHFPLHHKYNSSTLETFKMLLPKTQNYPQIIKQF